MGLLCSTFSAPLYVFLAKRFQLHALRSRKKSEVVRAHYTNSNFLCVELLHGGVYGAEFVEQSQTPLKYEKTIIRSYPNSFHPYRSELFSSLPIRTLFIPSWPRRVWSCGAGIEGPAIDAGGVGLAAWLTSHTRLISRSDTPACWDTNPGRRLLPCWAYIG